MLSMQALADQGVVTDAMVEFVRGALKKRIHLIPCLVCCSLRQENPCQLFFGTLCTRGYGNQLLGDAFPFDTRILVFRASPNFSASRERAGAPNLPPTTKSGVSPTAPRPDEVDQLTDWAETLAEDAENDEVGIFAARIAAQTYSGRTSN